MREVFVFRPPRRNGMLLHGIATLIMTTIGTFGLWEASHVSTSSAFLLSLLITISSIGTALGLIYRMYALQRARYILARDGISIFWGLRREEIPINLINWVGSADQNRMKLSKPIFHLPGAVLGIKTQADGKPVEFMASRDTHLVMIVTSNRIFAISPDNEAEFMRTYHKLAEFGSLAPIPSISVYPTFLLLRSWADRPARILLIISLLLASGLIVWVSFNIPNHPMIALRLNPDGSPIELVPGIRLLLLPVLNTFFFITDLLLGLFFYRKEDTQSLGYLMWACSSLTSLLFLGAIFFILRVT